MEAHPRTLTISSASLTRLPSPARVRGVMARADPCGSGHHVAMATFSVLPSPQASLGLLSWPMSLRWPDCTLSLLRCLAGDDRSTTQSIAIPGGGRCRPPALHEWRSERSTEWRITSHHIVTSRHTTSHHITPRPTLSRRAARASQIVRTYTWRDGACAIEPRCRGVRGVRCVCAGAAGCVRACACAFVRVR